MKITKRQLRRIIKEQQMTLNQDEVDDVADMASTLDAMFQDYRKIQSVPQEWLDSGKYEKLEEVLFDASEMLLELSADMLNGGI